MRVSGALTLALVAQASAVVTKRALDANSHGSPKVTPDLESTAAGSTLAGAYIVQLDPSHDSASFYSNLTASGIETVERQTFQPNIFAGTSFHLKSDTKANVDKINSFAAVKAITPVRLFSVAMPKDYSTAKWNMMSKRTYSTTNDTFATHVMTGVDKLHKEGILGKGKKIAVIDTGIDYTLKALGGGFGPGYKVAFGTDLVGDDYTGSNTPVPDNDPIDCAGHGTHVAGIIGANGDDWVYGVAPEATLGIYKVFGCTGNVANDVLIQAFTMAHNYGVDLITASIGGANGWPEEPWTAATAAIVAAGTPCMLAAGNDGADGMYYASAASAGTDVTSVGSVDNIYLPTALYAADYTVDNGTNLTFTYSLALGTFADVKLPLWADTYDTTVTDDGCNGFSADLTGKIVLIRRGTCTFVQKANNAAAAGAKYVMFYNNVEGVIEAAVTGSTITAAGMVTPEIGANWISLLAAGKTVTLAFPPAVELLITSPGPLNNVTGGYMSDYTTWGLTNDNNIKPVVSAPGGNILSTYLSSHGGYAVLSGTSMATPFIAGVVALYLSQFPNASPKTINAALAGTAKPLKYNDATSTYPYLAPVAQQGGGLVDAYHMIHAGIAITETNLALNDTANHVKNAAFYVENIGKTTVTYTLTHLPAGNAYAFDASDPIIPAFYPPPTDTKYASVAISPNTLTISPGAKKRVTIAATPDPSLDASLVPVYSGYIKITSSTGESISIPYAGVATVMNTIKILETGNIWPYFDDSETVGTYAFKYGGNSTVEEFQPSANSYPYFYWNNIWATPSMRLDVVRLDGPNPVRAAGLNTVGSVPGFPWLYNPRGISGTYNSAGWDGTLDSGATVPSGVYKFVLRLAKVFADLNRPAEYEVYSSTAFYMNMS